MSVPIVVTSFCRPELTRSSTLHLIEHTDNTEIILSQDGPIRGYYEVAHKQTREIMIELSKEFPQIRLNLREKNQGLLIHLLELFKSIFRESDNLIFLEEDMEISRDGLLFLSAITKDIGISHRCAFNSTGHPASADEMDYRLSYFPEQWGISLNRNAFLAFEDEFKRNQVERSIVRGVVREAGFRGINSELLTDYWTKLMRSEISKPHGWDALLQFSLWRNQKPSLVSFRPFVRDLGGGIGSITKRDSSLKALKSSNHISEIGVQCFGCDSQDPMRRHFSAVSQIRSRLRIRTRLHDYFVLRQFK